MEVDETQQPDEQTPVGRARSFVTRLLGAMREPGTLASSLKERLFGVAPEAVAEARQHGLELEGYTHVVDGSAIVHIFKEHGDPAREIRRGQLPITDSDLQSIPEVIAAPDKVIYGTRNRHGLPQIGYIKKMPDGSVIYLEEVRKGRRELAANSMRKYPATIDVPSLLKSVNLNVRNDGGDTLRVVDSPEPRNALLGGEDNGGAAATDSGASAESPQPGIEARGGGNKLPPPPPPPRPPRDPISEQYFSGNNIKVILDDKPMENEEDAAELYQLAGAPSGSTVFVRSNSFHELSFSIKHPYIVKCVGVIDEAGGTIYNDHLEVASDAPPGFGTRMVASEIFKAASLGFKKISANAARGKALIGYSFWPPMGFDAELPPDMIARLPDSLKGKKTLLDLNSTTEGHAWWRANGDSIDVVFDLSEGSRSMRKLRTYLAEKGIKL